MPKIRQKGENSEIWCVIRRKWVVCTPEERVRQWFIEVLISNGIEWGRISVEQTVEIANRSLRADLIVYDVAGKADILVECKAPNIEIDDAVFAQAINYNRVLGVRQIILTNGNTTLSKTL